MRANVTHSIAARFSAAAATYQAAAEIQRAVAERLSELVPADEAVDRILEIGCGTGLLTAHLCRLFPHSRIDALDLAEGMVLKCRALLAGGPRSPEAPPRPGGQASAGEPWSPEAPPSAGEPGLRCQVTDLASFRPEAAYPLIVSSSTLHWIYPLDEVMAKLAGWLAPRGALVFALMVSGTLAELHSARQRVAPHKPPGRYLPTTGEVKKILEQAGLAIEEEWEESRRQVFASAGDFLRKLHDQGVTGGPLARQGRMLNRSDLSRLAQDYEAHYRHDGGVYASYLVSYFRARKT